jgi:hypothetical protein
MNSWDLTDQQWYNVCKHYPYVARQASAVSGRPLLPVSRDSPYDKTSGSMGRLFMPNREPGEEG